MLGGMPRSDPVDGFRLAYDRAGRGPAVLLLHGWPGDRIDYRAVVPRVTAAMEATAAGVPSGRP
jgi:pimeloyl-ACP methyl ester carboxylesterase